MGDEKINLKLIGKNEDDLKIISAHLQDSIVTVKDIVFLKRNRSFVMIVNRFMWEDVERGVFRYNKRIKCAIKFEGVIEVKSKNINQKNKNKSLEYLAMKFDPTIDGNNKISIFFSGNSSIILILEDVELVMNDLGSPWKVKHTPKHKI